MRELQLLKAYKVIISSNVPLRRDGLPYANYRQPEDPGVAVYFQLNKPHVLACDHWNCVKDNLRAIGLHVAAIRGIERWGVGSVEQAFTGYQALPESSSDNSAHKSWWIVLQVDPGATPAQIKEAYRALARKHHPDVNGNGDQMATINRAWEEAQRERSL